MPPRSASPHDAFVALGSNLGDRAAALRGAVEGLAAHPRIRVSAASPVYETAAHTRAPGETQPDFLNAVVRISTSLGPLALLEVCQRLERAAGRDRRDAETWAPRTLDLDVLLFDDLSLRMDRLSIPHPRMAERRFVLQPLADLAPDLRLPVPLDGTVAERLAACPDGAALRRTDDRLAVPSAPRPR